MRDENKTYQPTGYIRIPEILNLIPISKSTWWNWVNEGKVPKGVKLSSRVTAWRKPDIHALMASFDNEGVQL